MLIFSFKDIRWRARAPLGVEGAPQGAEQAGVLTAVPSDPLPSLPSPRYSCAVESAARHRGRPSGKPCGAAVMHARKRGSCGTRLSGQWEGNETWSLGGVKKECVFFGSNKIRRDLEADGRWRGLERKATPHTGVQVWWDVRGNRGGLSRGGLRRGRWRGPQN